MVTTIDRGNGAMLVLLDLSAAFDTIEDDIFCILEKNVEICGNALKLFKVIFFKSFKLIKFLVE